MCGYSPERRHILSEWMSTRFSMGLNEPVREFFAYGLKSSVDCHDPRDWFI
jgi:hypothetical protein